MTTKFIVIQFIGLILFDLEFRADHVTKEISSPIDIGRSVIRWKGTKMVRTGSHEGTIRFKTGRLELRDGNVIGGEFTVDMKSIEITDIPVDDPIPRNALKEHLEADFDIERFPLASLVIKGAVKENNLCGQLTIKGVTREVCFAIAKRDKKIWVTTLILKRDDFKIGEKGSWLENKLVDQEMYLDMEVHLQ